MAVLPVLAGPGTAGVTPPGAAAAAGSDPIPTVVKTATATAAANHLFRPPNDGTGICKNSFSWASRGRLRMGLCPFGGRQSAGHGAGDLAHASRRKPRWSSAGKAIPVTRLMLARTF